MSRHFIKIMWKYNSTGHKGNSSFIQLVNWFIEYQNSDSKLSSSFFKLFFFKLFFPINSNYSLESIIRWYRLCFVSSARLKGNKSQRSLTSERCSKNPDRNIAHIEWFQLKNRKRGLFFHWKCFLLFLSLSHFHSDLSIFVCAWFSPFVMSSLFCSRITIHDRLGTKN